jgi:hypothetical protein
LERGGVAADRQTLPLVVDIACEQTKAATVDDSVL